MRTILAAAVVVVLITACAASAQQSTGEPQQKPESRALLTVTGELVSVNADTHTIRVRKSDNNEMEFSYSPETEVLGADKGMSGLATLRGSEVTVHYSFHGKTYTAEKIEVKAKNC